MLCRNGASEDVGEEGREGERKMEVGEERGGKEGQVVTAHELGGMARLGGGLGREYEG